MLKPFGYLTRREVGEFAVAATVAASVGQAAEKTPPEMEYHFDARVDGLGDRIRKARETKGLTIEQCAYAFEPGMDNYWYGEWQRWESGTDSPSYSYWPTLEALLGVPATQLIFGGSERALAGDWVRERLAKYEPSEDITEDSQRHPHALRLCLLRESQNMTFADCAEAVGVDEVTWIRFECGMIPDFRQTMAILKRFGVTWDSLLT